LVAILLSVTLLTATLSLSLTISLSTVLRFAPDELHIVYKKRHLRTFITIVFPPVLPELPGHDNLLAFNQVLIQAFRPFPENCKVEK
jgi:hypothetical protein